MMTIPNIRYTWIKKGLKQMSIKNVSKNDIFNLIKQLIFKLEPSSKNKEPHQFINAEELHLWVKINNDLSLVLDQYEFRAYSNMNHIYSGLKLFNDLKHQGVAIPVSVVVTWVLHDVILDEEECALFAKTLIKSSELYKMYVNAGHIAHLIKATKYYHDTEMILRLTLTFRNAIL